MSAFTTRRSQAPWYRAALCGAHPELDWHSSEADQRRRCIQICQECPVATACLTEALATGDPWGVWGGMTAGQREHHAEQHGLPVPIVRPTHGTNTRYTKHHCRCAACRQAHTAAVRRQRARIRDAATTKWTSPAIEYSERNDQPRCSVAAAGVDAP
ncbi:WhiB family transcriptional regulator [Sciscionella sp. SE31]|uniref:WhiB family transcriptional regulator n=1 Tax=Sciscionella sediminilitoris TaxID=1445613 RepID=UPI000560DC81